MLIDYYCLTDKLNLKRSDEYVALLNLRVYMEKYKKVM